VRRWPARFAGVNRCLLLIILGLAGCATAQKEPSPNLTILKWRCIHWHDSGAYAQAFAHAAEPARITLDRYIREGVPKNAAIVFDIDETLLSNWPYLVSTQFALEPKTFAAWTKSEHAIALAPTRGIYALAQAHQIPIYLVTGRDESLRAATIRDLHEAGYTGWSGLFLKPANYSNPSIIPFKSGVRKMLAAEGHDILLNMGDQYSDLEGGYARNSFKLPNPFYYLP